MPLPTLVVEDGTGLSSANSYVSYQEAVDYVFRIPDLYSSAWQEIRHDEFKITQLAIWATQLLDDWLYFPGTFRVYQFQALNFPMLGLVDQSGVYIPHSPLPAFIKRATSQMMFELSKSDRVVEPTRGLSAASVGPLSVTFDPNQSHVAKTVPRSVAVIVVPYGGKVRGASGIRTVDVYRS